MTNRLRAWWRTLDLLATQAARAAVLLSGFGLALLAGCGPGVAGTGTGSASGLDHFGAEPRAVCDAAFAAQIGCAPGELAPQTAAVYGDACTRLSFGASEARVEESCLGLAFEGVWGQDGQGAQRFYGVAGPAGDEAAAVPATLEVQVDGDALIVHLRGPDGDTVIAPRRLTPLPPPG